MQKFERTWFSKLMDGIGWLLIFLCPFLALGALGVIAFLALGFWLGLIIGVFLVFSGAILGFLFAQWVSKKMGTMFFISRVSATPQLDGRDDQLAQNRKDQTAGAP